MIIEHRKIQDRRKIEQVRIIERRQACRRAGDEWERLQVRAEIRKNARVADWMARYDTARNRKGI